jgi:radical SAM protein with 4Fe4S-binding SPASM domain
MCDRWREEKKIKIISLEEKKKVLILLKEWLGPFRLILGSRGEAFMEEEIFELVKFASKIDIITSVTSNGFLIDKTMAEKIVSSGLNHLVISLDGIDEKTHDWVRGVQGSFQRVQRAIELLNKDRGGMSLLINSIIMEQNLDQLVDLVKLVSEKGLDGIFFLQLESKFHYGKEAFSNDWFKDNELWPKDLRKVKEVLDRLISLKKEGYCINNSFDQLEMFKSYFSDPSIMLKKDCFVGIQNLTIDADGNVYLCINFDPVGNIFEKKPKDIWNSPEARKRREEIKRCRAHCRVSACYYRKNFLEKFEQFLKHRRLHSNYRRMRDGVR